MHMQMIAGATQPGEAGRGGGVSLLFAQGLRPDLAAIERILAADDAARPHALISHRSAADEGWVELLANGLTFELQGLAPAASGATVAAEHRFGLDAGVVPDRLEAVRLVPAAHIAAGGRLLPVVRAITGLAVGFALMLPVAAVCWEAAESWMEPSYFARVIVNWLSGGPFPALGLTALERHDDGSVGSVGLAFFAGQEIHVEPRAGETGADTAKLALRVVDYVIRFGAIDRLIQLDSPTGEIVFAEPLPTRRVAKVWRGG